MFVDKKYGVELDENTILNGTDHDLPDGYPYSMEDIRSKVKMVRQGLLQGDVCAPQIARTFLGRELQHVLVNGDVAYGSHLDDVLLGARTRPELKTSLKALTHRLTSHPAGPIDLHEHLLRHIANGIFHVGYRVSLRKDGDVYVRPGRKRFDRFRERLLEKLAGSVAYTKEELWQVAFPYARSWFNSHPAWTRGKQSWNYVLSEVKIIINVFIYIEYKKKIANWTEDDIDWGLLIWHIGKKIK